MKLATEIPLRSDGVVCVSMPDGTEYVFRPDEGGLVSTTVKDKGHVHYLLETGNFYPVEEADIEAALDDIGEADDEEADEAETDVADVKRSRKKSR